MVTVMTRSLTTSRPATASLTLDSDLGHDTSIGLYVEVEEDHRVKDITLRVLINKIQQKLRLYSYNTNVVGHCRAAVGSLHQAQFPLRLRPPEDCELGGAGTATPPGKHHLEHNRWEGWCHASLLTVPAVTWYPGPAPRHAVLVVRSSALAPPPATLSAWTNADPGTCRT